MTAPLLRRKLGLSLVAAAIVAIWPVSGALAADAKLAMPTNAKLIATAKAEGKLTFYGTSSVVALKSDADAFQKAYGIPATFTRLTSGPLTARVDQEIRAGGITADIVITADRYSLYRWIADGQIAPLPAGIKFPDRTEHIAQVQAVYQAIFYNKKTVAAADVPKTWSDVLNPKFQGKIVIGSPRISPAYSELYYALWKDPKYGEPFFQKLAAQRPRVVRSNALVSQTVNSGEVSLGFTALPYDAVNIQLRSPGAPIEYAYLDIITLAPTFIAINAKAKNPNAARLFASYMLSPAGQVAHNGEGRASSVMGSLPGTLAAPARSRVRTEITPEKVSPEYSALIALFDKLFQ